MEMFVNKYVCQQACALIQVKYDQSDFRPVCLSVCLSFCVSLYLSLSLCLCVCLFVTLYG